jgi:DNA-binding NarL/FixJ family response regulator
MRTHPRKQILLVDDHPLLRQGIAQLVNEQSDLLICGEAEDCASAFAAAERLNPDLAVIDISLKGQSGLELIKDLKARFPAMAILVLSMHDESLYAERALRAGARGYIMKREASLKVLDAIRYILNGGVYVSGNVTAAILNRASGRSSTSSAAMTDVLSDRELEILTLIGNGYGSKQIASQLHISIKTVESHRANIKLKLDLGSSQDLLQFAIRLNQTI